jgi:hypothetical protein
VRVKTHGSSAGTPRTPEPASTIRRVDEGCEGRARWLLSRVRLSAWDARNREVPTTDLSIRFSAGGACLVLHRGVQVAVSEVRSARQRDQSTETKQLRLPKACCQPASLPSLRLAAAARRDPNRTRRIPCLTRYATEPSGSRRSVSSSPVLEWRNCRSTTSKSAFGSIGFDRYASKSGSGQWSAVAPCQGATRRLLVNSARSHKCTRTTTRVRARLTRPSSGSSAVAAGRHGRVPRR